MSGWREREIEKEMGSGRERKYTIRVVLSNWFRKLWIDDMTFYFWNIYVAKINF